MLFKRRLLWGLTSPGRSASPWEPLCEKEGKRKIKGREKDEKRKIKGREKEQLELELPQLLSRVMKMNQRIEMNRNETRHEEKRTNK